MKQSRNFQRAQNLVMQDKFDFRKDAFCKELSEFLQNYFTFDSLTVDVVEGKRADMIVCINVENVKKTYTPQS